VVYPKATVNGIEVVPGKCYEVNTEETAAGDAGGAGGGGVEGGWGRLCSLSSCGRTRKGRSWPMGEFWRGPVRPSWGMPGDEFEVFLTEECLDVHLRDIRWVAHSTVQYCT